MKRMAGFALGIILAAPALAVDLAQWTFETSIPTTAGPHAAEGGLYGGNASGFHSNANVVYSNPVGNGSLESFSSNFWSAGDYYQFQTSTVGYEAITVMWDQTRSSTGPGDFALEYSVDGTNYTSVMNYTVDVITWSSLSYNALSTFGPISLPAAADNQTDLWVRLTANVAGSATTGTNRVDDIVIAGRLIPEPASLTLIGFGALALIRRR